MKTQIIRKQFVCVTDVCVIGQLSSREFLCVIGASQEVPYGGTRITQNNSYQKALCNKCPV